MPENDQIAAVRQTLVGVRLIGVENHATLLARAKELAPDPTIFDQYPPIFFSAEASNANRDSYFTRMQPSSLKNYATDATAGRAFQDSHKRDSVARTLGMTLAGKYQNKHMDQPARTTIDVYSVQGLDPSIDQFIGRMRAGITRDVSIGFTDGRYMCSICGREMYDWWAEREARCTHFAGVEYPMMGADGKPNGEKQVAEALIEDARLSEVSAVFDGATPGAGIIGIKARQMADAGLLLPAVRSALVDRYNITLPGGKNWAGVDLPATPEEERMPKEGESPVEETKPEERKTPAPAPDLLVSIRAVLGTAEDATPEQIVSAITTIQHGARAHAETETERARLAAEVARLTPLADDGSTYRADLIANAIDAGVRAFGDQYEREQDEAELKGLPLAGIKRRIVAYETAAGKVFAKGRATEDGDPDSVPNLIRGKGRRKAPDAAFVS